MSQAISQVPPQNRDAERGVLGGILRDPDVLPDVLAVLRPEAMYFDAHRRILAAIADLAGRNQPVDLVLLYDSLRKGGQLEDVGGQEYLVDLWEAVPTGANTVYYAKLVRDAARLRGLIHACNEILRDAHAPTGPVAELLARAEQKLFALNADLGPDVEPRPLGELAREALDELDDRIGSGAELAGLPTGYPGLDEVTGGLKPGDLIVLGARPSLGKTAMSLNIAERVAKAGGPVLFFSLEMPGIQIAQRMLSMESGVPMSKMDHAPELRPADIDALVAAGRAAGGLPLSVVDTPNASAALIQAVAARAYGRTGLKLIVVDYLGLMQPENPRENKAQQIGTLALRMKNLARGLKVPLLLLAQLNRDSEQQNRKPRLSDLRESGEIEQHADRVFFLHREPGLKNDAAVWPVEVVVAKNRNGPIGDVRLEYRRPVLRFENVMIGD